MVAKAGGATGGRQRHWWRWRQCQVGRGGPTSLPLCCPKAQHCTGAGRSAAAAHMGGGTRALCRGVTSSLAPSTTTAVPLLLTSLSMAKSNCNKHSPVADSLNMPAGGGVGESRGNRWGIVPPRLATGVNMIYRPQSLQSTMLVCHLSLVKSHTLYLQPT